MSYQQISKVMSLPRTPSFQQIQLCLYKILSSTFRPSHLHGMKDARLLAILTLILTVVTSRPNAR